MTATACLVTGGERAAIATIIVCGDSAAETVASNFAANAKRSIVSGDVRYGTWHGCSTQSDSAVRESVVVVAVSDRHGSLWTWEIHCHGGEVAAKRILEDLARGGATVVNQQQWLAMACPDMLEREAIDVLSRTATARTAAIVLDQVRGAMRDFALDSVAAIANRPQMAIESIKLKAATILRLAEFGRHLSDPWKVVLAGPPNVGKSSLINALVGYRRSITMDQPGTTRDVLLADAVIQGWPILLSDTAGIRLRPTGEIERQGIDLALKSLQEADMVLWVSDASDPKREAAAATVDLPVRSLNVLNKIDIAQTIDGAIDVAMGPEAICVSATQGIGIDALRAAMIKKLVPSLPEPGSPVALTQRQVDALSHVVSARDDATLRQSLDRLLGNVS